MNIFETKDGKRVIAQRPNAPIIAAFGAAVGARIVEGSLGDFLSVLASTLFLIWGLIEILWGVNTWRRILGSAVVIIVLV